MRTYPTRLSDLTGAYIEGRDLESLFDDIESEILDEDGNVKPGSDPELVTDRIALKDIFETIAGYSGERLRDTTLIADWDFERFAAEYAEEIGALDRNMQWPGSCIDWKKAADQLQQDYTSVEINGTDYWFR